MRIDLRGFIRQHEVWEHSDQEGVTHISITLVNNPANLQGYNGMISVPVPNEWIEDLPLRGKVKISIEIEGRK